MEEKLLCAYNRGKKEAEDKERKRLESVERIRKKKEEERIQQEKILRDKAANLANSKVITPEQLQTVAVKNNPTIKFSFEEFISPIEEFKAVSKLNNTKYKIFNPLYFTEQHIEEVLSKRLEYDSPMKQLTYKDYLDVKMKERSSF